MCVGLTKSDRSNIHYFDKNVNTFDEKRQKKGGVRLHRQCKKNANMIMNL